MKINTNYDNVSQSYLFSTIAKKVAAYAAAHPDKKIIKLGIGDVTLPLAPAVIEALHGAVDEMGKKGEKALLTSINLHGSRRNLRGPHVRPGP